MEEITTIYNKKFASKRLEQVRDLFIFSCYTALSYIDVCELTQENIRTSFDGNLWIMTKRHKTNVASNIRLLDVPKAILEKYKDQLPSGMILPIISNQKVNEYLKEIASICSINKSLTFHVARHTCVSKGTIKSLRSKLSQIDLRIPTNHPTQKHIQFLLRTFGRNFKKCT